MTQSSARPTPSGWVLVRLGQVADIRLGKMLSPKAQEAGLVRRRYLRNDNVRWGCIELGDVKEMGFWAKELDRYGVEPGDLLVCEGGEPGRCAVYRGPSGALMYQKALHRVRPHGDVCTPDLLQRWLRHLAFSGALVPKIAQTTIQHLPLERFLEVEIPLPPFAEQARIVAALDQHLTRLGAAVEALRRVRAKLKTYRASVLKAACEGRLVSTEAELARRERRGYETAGELLRRIGVAGNAADDSELGPAPEGWARASLGHVAEIQGGIQKQPKRAPVRNAYPFLRVANVQRGRLELSDVHQIELFGDELRKLRLRAGDLLIVEGNGSPSEIGRMAIWAGAIEDCVHQNHIIRARLREGVLGGYVAGFWNSPSGAAQVLDVASSTSGLYTLSVAKVGRLVIPLPPLAEQHRIVSEVERRVSVLEKLEAVVETGLDRAEKLRQAILKRAFEGRLVPQDPKDEPASVLLERIRAERAAAGQQPVGDGSVRRRAGRRSGTTRRAKSEARG